MPGTKNDPRVRMKVNAVRGALQNAIAEGQRRRWERSQGKGEATRFKEDGTTQGQDG